MLWQPSPRAEIKANDKHQALPSHTERKHPYTISWRAGCHSTNTHSFTHPSRFNTCSRNTSLLEFHQGRDVTGGMVWMLLLGTVGAS